MYEEAEFLDPLPKRNPIEFEDQHGLVLRQLTEQDSQELLQFAIDNKDGNEEFASQLNVINTEHEALKMINNTKLIVLGARLAKDGPLAALVTIAHEPEDEADKREVASLGFVVGKGFQRQGVASNAVRTVSSNLLKTPQFNTVRCYVNPNNVISRKLLEKCGFELRGGRFNVNLVYELDESRAGVTGVT